MVQQPNRSDRPESTSKKAGRPKTHNHPLSCAIGRRVRYYREKAGLSIEALAVCLEIKDQQYKKYESGSSMLTAEKLHILALTLQVRHDQFFETCDDYVLRNPSVIDGWPNDPGNGEVRLLEEAYRSIKDKELRARLFMQVWLLAGMDQAPPPEEDPTG